MDAKIKLLEERVNQAADRIGNLNDEQKRMRGELETLQKHAAELEEIKTALSGGLSREEWNGKVLEIDGMIEEAITTLKRD
jgi:chromosome segregation ATPase